MLTFVEKYGKNIFSQNSEDGVIKECLKRIGVHYNLVCEFGAADGYYCSNTAATHLPRVLFEADKTMRHADLHKPNELTYETITPENVNDLVPQKLDVLSIDVDGNDYNIWKAYKGVANIVVIEINSSIEPGSTFFESDPKKGTDYLSMLQLGIRKGYFLLCHTGNNLFILNKFSNLFPEINGHDPIRDWQLYFNKSWLNSHTATSILK